MMDYPYHAISPGLSQASCGSPNYDSEFASNGSPGQYSTRSGMSMSPGRISPGTLPEKDSVFGLTAFTRPSTTVDVDTTSTPYSDATKSRKPAKEGRVKRPMNAFMVWAQQERRLLTANTPGLHNAQVSKHLGHVWKIMPEKEKAVWREEAARLKELHDREFPSYKYQPRKKITDIQMPVIITDSGRVSKPVLKNWEVTKPPAKASRSKGGKAKASGGRKNSVPVSTTTTTVDAEVNSSLVSMLQARPQQRFQNLGAVASFPSATIVKSEPTLPKQFNRVVIDDEFRKGGRESQTVESSTEITPPAQNFHNPAFRSTEMSPSPVSTEMYQAPTPSPVSTEMSPSPVSTEMYQAPTPSPVSSHNTTASLSLADHAADMGMVIKTEIDEDTALLLDELPHAVTPAIVMVVGDSLIVSQYQSGATVTYNRDTKECSYDNLAPLQAIPDLSSIDNMCMTALDEDPTMWEEMDNSRNIIPNSDINWEDIAKDDVTGNDFTMINTEDIEYVSETLPDNIFADD